MPIDLRIHALSRSGCHAVAHWIASHQPGRCVLQNYVGRGCFSLNTYIDGRPQGLRTRPIGPDSHFRESEPEFTVDTATESCIVLYEEVVPSGDTPNDAPAITVLRDPLNWLSSRLRQGGRPANAASQMGLWVQFAKQCRAMEPDVSCVSFPDWFSESADRNRIAARVGFTNEGRGLQDVTKSGGGSSFSGRRLNGRAQCLRVLDRWPLLFGYKDFYDALKSPVAVELLFLGCAMFDHIEQVHDGIGAIHELRSHLLGESR